MKRKISDQIAGADRELADWKFAGKKNQYLFEFESDFDFPTGLYRHIAELTGLKLKRMTLCERHVKVYDSNADPRPIPHKDRLASEVVVGFPVVVPEDSHVALYPSASQAENPFQSTAQWRKLVSTPEQTTQSLQDVKPVRIFARPGDVVLFKGSRMFHERMNGAGSILLFLKFNAMRMDPLGEDPSTARFEARTANIAKTLSDDRLLAERLEVSPRLQKVTAYYDRRDWRQVYLAALWDESDFVLEEADVRLIEAVDRGVENVQELADNIKGTSKQQLCAAIRRLCSMNLIILPDGYPYEGNR